MVQETRLFGITIWLVFDQHRGLADCEAGCSISSEAPLTGISVLESVRNFAMSDQYLIKAVDFPRNKTELLKQRRYRWRPYNVSKGGCWWTLTENADAEISWLESNSDDPHSKFHKESVPATKRFSDRMWE